jgi:hypothetical protein
MRSAVIGWTKAEMSPPSTAISRTIVAERKRYLSEGVRKSVSTRARAPVHARELELVFEVGNGAQPAQDHPACCCFTNSESRPVKPSTFTFA